MAKALRFGVALGLLVAPLTAGAQQVPFDSYTALPWTSILNRRVAERPKVQIKGQLVLPERTTGRLPVMVIMHGSAGLRAHEYRYVRELTREGIGAAVLDSFTPRGIASTGWQQQEVTSLTMVGDVYALLNRLVHHPRINPSRIGIMGFSKGGAVAMFAADDHMRRALAEGDNRFALHVAFYPSCVVQLKFPQPTGAPLLMLLGELDSYTPAIQCQRYIKRMRAAGFPVSSITYRNAHHGWDAPFAVQSSMFDYSYGGCRVELDEAGGAIELTSGLRPDSTEAARKALAMCGRPGVVVGRNEVAARQSLEDLKKFVKRSFGLQADGR